MADGPRDRRRAGGVPRLLASLYAAAEGFDPSRPRASAGFAEG